MCKIIAVEARVIKCLKQCIYQTCFGSLCRLILNSSLMKLLYSARAGKPNLNTCKAATNKERIGRDVL